MKKILALAAAAVLGTASVFAFEVGELSGTWKDTNWDANWTISADTNGKGQIVLTRASTGEKLFTFNDDNIQNYKLSGSLSSGLTITFDCKATGRSYKFNKPVSLGKDLNLDIDRSWTTEAYNVTITWQGGNAGVDGTTVVESNSDAQ